MPSLSFLQLLFGIFLVVFGFLVLGSTFGFDIFTDVLLAVFGTPMTRNRSERETRAEQLKLAFKSSKHKILAAVLIILGLVIFLKVFI